MRDVPLGVGHGLEHPEHTQKAGNHIDSREGRHPPQHIHGGIEETCLQMGEEGQ